MGLVSAACASGNASRVPSSKMAASCLGLILM
jgi:hypothetical protein